MLTCNICYCARTTAFWGWRALYFEKRDNSQRRDKRGSFKMLRLSRAWRVYSQLSSSETNLLSEVYRRSGRLPGRGPAGFVPRGTKPRELPWRCPRPAGTLAGELAELSRRGRCSLPGRPGGRDRPSAAERGGSACAQSPTEEADATFLCVFMACLRGKVPSLSPLGLLRPSFLPGSSGGSREGPGAARPRTHRDGARGRRSPPGAAARGLQGKDLVLPLSRGSLWPDELLRTSSYNSFSVRKIRVIVKCNPHTFLTIVITKLIAGPKTDVKTS